MTCSKCGAGIEPGQLFCPMCGHEINLVPEYNEFDDLVHNYNSLNIEPEVTEEKPEKEKNDRKTNMFKITVFLVALFIVNVAVLLGINSKKNSSSYEVQMKKAVTYYEEGNYRKAEDKINRALAIKKNDLNAMVLLSDVYTKEGNKEKAKVVLEKAIIERPREQVLYDRLFEILIEEKQYDRINEMIKESPISDDLKSVYSKYYVDLPEINMANGSYHEPVTVKIESGANKVYYTLDGSTPNESSTPYEHEIKMDKEGFYQLKAVAYNSNDSKSDVIEAYYTITFPLPDSPNVNLPTGKYSTEDEIEVTVPNDCKAYYTWDGKMPTEKSSLYKGPVKVKKGSNIFTIIAISPYGKSSYPTIKSYDGIDFTDE